MFVSSNPKGEKDNVQQSMPLAPTQDDSDKLKEKGLTPKGMSERFMQTLRFLTPLSQDKDEGCDDYLNALGESGDGDQQLAADRTQTKTETPTTQKKKSKRKKKKDKQADSGKFVRNTMDNVPVR
ncbi:hypothetical protein TELCIR_09633 [Teladorsagia circumcincta]|uniref:Uncharacterized protein n=1 Tax=Teladorsagia circumcincta TaxID=45464 RepID=A0A2G9UEA0_TELCI|nr:hypothetical protein TELCIR_09633 [Teladorsagia circumcincta]